MSMTLRKPVTPFPDPAQHAVQQLLVAIGEDPAREGLVRTPERVAKAMSVEKQGARTSTAEYLGEYRDSASLRGEFLQAVSGPTAEPWRK